MAWSKNQNIKVYLYTIKIENTFIKLYQTKSHRRREFTKIVATRYVYVTLESDDNDNYQLVIFFFKFQYKYNIHYCYK